MTGPHTRLLDLLDAVPAAERALLSGIAWDDRLGCGCFFGHFWREHLRSPGSPGRWSVNFVNAFAEPAMSVLPGFRQWAEGLGLTLDNVQQLQEANDRFHHGINDAGIAQSRYAHMRAFVACLAGVAR